MKNFDREDLLFSLCGLNCGLCSMKLGGYCPGCGGGEGNQPCAAAKCSREHGGVEYCYQCGEFPCGRYAAEDEFDSFITHRNRLRDVEKARKMGPEAYAAEQREKVEFLGYLLEHCNDGRRKTFFCLAVNLLELDDLRAAMKQIAAEPDGLPLKDRAAAAVLRLQSAADEKGIELKLRKKPKKMGPAGQG